MSFYFPQDDNVSQLNAIFFTENYCQSFLFFICWSFMYNSVDKIEHIKLFSQHIY